jgi:polyhydroxybutyrate depolymerase
MRQISMILVLVLIVAIVGYYNFAGPSVDPQLLQVTSHNYLEPANKTCSTAPSGAAGSIDDNITPTGARYNLRTPTNYQASVAHPLVVVFAPAGTSAKRSERLTHLTQQATAKGFIIAYANNIRLSLKAIESLASIPTDIQKKWCIDPERVYYTGHSDGGTVSHALSFLPDSTAKPTAIAPSAAGLDTVSLQQYPCPAPTAVMVFHNTDDSHFDGFGRQAADWWASCNQCSGELTAVDQQGCRRYKACPSTGAQTYYCEGPGTHVDWPNKNALMLGFFAQH